MNRRWRIDTALAVDHARARLSTRSTSSSPASSPARDPALADAGGRGPAQQRDLFLPRPAAVRPAARRPGQAARAGARRASKRLSIWCAGCSTGQEAYSLAMSFADEKARWQGWTIDIVGTDLSRAAIERARSRHLFAVRGPARPSGHADDPLVRGAGRRRLADRRAAARPVRFEVAQPHRAAAARRAGSTSSCAATSCSISRPRCAGWPSTGSPRRSRPTAR